MRYNNFITSIANMVANNNKIQTNLKLIIRWKNIRIAAKLLSQLCLNDLKFC